MKIFSRAAKGVTTLAAAAAAFAMAACSSGTNAPAGGAAFETDQQQQQGLTERCSGTYTCAVDGSHDTATTELHRDGATCYAGRLLLMPDGEARGDDKGTVQRLGTWKGDAHAFDVCEGSACLRCKANGSGGATSPAQPNATCTGTPASCERGAGDCGAIRGCNLHTHYTYSNGSVSGTEYQCLGSPDACSTFADRAACERQSCTWK